MIFLFHGYTTTTLRCTHHLRKLLHYTFAMSIHLNQNEVSRRIHYVPLIQPKPLVFSLCIALSSLALLHYLTGIGIIQYDHVQLQNVKESECMEGKKIEWRHYVSKSVTNHITCSKIQAKMVGSRTILAPLT